MMEKWEFDLELFTISFMIDEELIVMKSAITSKQSWKTDKPPLLINSEQKSSIFYKTIKESTIKRTNIKKCENITRNIWN